MITKAVLKRFARDHFAAVIFTGLAVVLAVDVFALERNRTLASLISLLLLAASVIYYLTYFFNYRKIVDHSPKVEFLFEVYSFWGVVAFGVLSIFVFALFGASLDHIWPNSVFHGASYFDVLHQLGLIILDFFSLGWANALGLNFGGIKEQGTVGRLYIQLATFLFKISLIAAIVATWKDFHDARRTAVEIFKGQLPDSSVSKRLIHALSRQYTKELVVPSEVEREILNKVRVSKSKPTRDLLLLIAQRTSDMTTFGLCLDYFASVRDSRLQKLIRHIEDSAKKEMLLERFRPIKPNTSQRKRIINPSK